MQDNSFGKNIESELHDWSIEPSDAVWSAVEKELDKKKRRYGIGWWLLLPLLLGSLGLGWYMIYQYNRQQRTIPPVSLSIQEHSTGLSTNQPLNQSTNQPLNQSAAPVIVGQKINSSISSQHLTTQPKRVATQKITAAKLVKGIKNPTHADADATTAGRRLYDDGKQKIVVMAADAMSDENQDSLISGLVLNEVYADTNRKDIMEAVLAPQTDTAKMEVGRTITTPTPTDSLPATSAEKKPASKSRSWRKEFLLAAGKAEFGSFNLSSSSYDFMNSPGSVTSSPGTPVRIRTAYKFGQGTYLQAGMNIGRPLTKRLTWFTGLHYHYQQLRGETRVSLDSFGINGNPNYVNISNSIYKVHLNIHQVNVPLLLRFSFTPALDITTGLYNNISISSNWKKYEDFLGKQKTYLPVWHIQPSYGYKNFALGPYLNVGLLKYETDKRLISYGLLLKYAVSK